MIYKLSDKERKKIDAEMRKYLKILGVKDQFAVDMISRQAVHLAALAYLDGSLAVLDNNIKQVIEKGNNE